VSTARIILRGVFLNSARAPHLLCLHELVTHHLFRLPLFVSLEFMPIGFSLGSFSSRLAVSLSCTADLMRVLACVGDLFPFEHHRFDRFFLFLLLLPS